MSPWSIIFSTAAWGATGDGGWCPDCFGAGCTSCGGTGLCDEVRAELAIVDDPYEEARDDNVI